MPGGKYDSSKTRVAPIFSRLAEKSDDWPRRLLKLAKYGSIDAEIPNQLDMNYVEGWWGANERGLRPPISLLSWLIRHPEAWAAKPDTQQRRQMCSGTPAVFEEALDSLRNSGTDSGWFIMEGRTYPDALVLTPDAIIVIEGKRTEAGPTTHTKWMAERHQIWRHIDAAWELRGQRHVFGMFIVEGNGTSIPDHWRQAAGGALGKAAILGSFPHRSSEEIAELRKCFLGVCTWHQVCGSFGFDASKLPDTVAEAGA